MSVKRESRSLVIAWQPRQKVLMSIAALIAVVGMYLMHVDDMVYWMPAGYAAGDRAWIGIGLLSTAFGLAFLFAPMEPMTAISATYLAAFLGWAMGVTGSPNAPVTGLEGLMLTISVVVAPPLMIYRAFRLRNSKKKLDQIAVGAVVLYLAIIGGLIVRNVLPKA